MLFLGYDPGGKGTHGVAAIDVSAEGEIVGELRCDVVVDAEAAWVWLAQHTGAKALGIDTLLAWSSTGSRECDNALRRKYPAHAPTIIPQNSLYSSMTLNGAIVARRAARSGLPLFESHPKLLTRIIPRTDRATRSLLDAYASIKAKGEGAKKDAKRADDMADAVVAAWCAAQGFSGRWVVDLFALPGDTLEHVVEAARYPWPEAL